MQPWVTVALPPTFQSLGWLTRGWACSASHMSTGSACPPWRGGPVPPHWACAGHLAVVPPQVTPGTPLGLAAGGRGAEKSLLKAACGQRGSDCPLLPRLCSYQGTPPVPTVEQQPLPPLPSLVPRPPKRACNNRDSPARCPGLAPSAACSEFLRKEGRMQRPGQGRTTSPRSSPVVGAQHMVCREARLAWSGAPGKTRQPPHLEATQTFVVHPQALPGTQGPCWGGQRALGFRCISQLGLGISAPRGGRGEQMPWGHLGTHALLPLFFLSGPQPGRGIFLPLGHTWDKHHLLREPSLINLAS